MSVTTKKIEPGRYAVFVGGRPTGLVIARGDAPRYGMRQEWSIGVSRAGRSDIDWIINDQPGLSHAVAAISAIVQECEVEHS